jgi:nucleoporin NDC1
VWDLIVLAGFTIASLEEDAYGVLQKDIPKILEAFTSYLIMLENYAVELQASAGAGDAEKKAQVVGGLAEVVDPLIGGGF